MEKIRTLLQKHKDIMLYLVFGGLTTLVNFVVYTPLLYWFAFSAAISNGVAWVVAVAFAFLTNKPFVFKSHDWSAAVLIPEMGKFVGCRVFSGVLETILLAVTVDMLHWHGVFMKVVCSVIVIISNYAFSKFFVFQGRSTDNGE